MDVHDLLSRLQKVKKTGPENWVACCPAHVDKNPSMTVRSTSDGKILMHCFAGCDVLAITGSIGVELSDLFPPSLDEAKKIPVALRWPAADVLKCVAKEALLTSIVAQGIVDGRPVSKTDLERVHVAAARLNQALETIRGLDAER